MRETIRLRVFRWPWAVEGQGQAVVLLGLGLALTLYYLSPGLWLPILGALLFLILAYLRLDLALLFVILSIPFYRFPRSFEPEALGLVGLLGRQPIQFSLSEFTLLACFLAWLAKSAPPLMRWRQVARSLFAQAGGLSRRRLHPALFFLLVATLSLLASEYLRFSLREYRTVILEPLLFYLLLVTTIDDRQRIWRCVDVFVLLGGMVSAFALYHYFFVGEVEATGGVSRMLAVYHSPNALALFLGRVAPIAVVLALWSSPGMRRLFYAVAGLALLAALFFTYSRGAWMGVGAALLFAAALRGRRPFLALAAVAVVVALALLPFLGVGRLVSEATMQQRLYLWQSAVQMIRDHPLLGVGLDNFLYQYPKYMNPEAWAEPDISHPHNVLLDFWTRLGILGVAALLWLQVGFWRDALRLHWGLQEPQLRLLTLALMASMLDFLVHGLLDNSLFLIDLAFVFWLTLGLLQGVRKEASCE